MKSAKSYISGLVLVGALAGTSARAEETSFEGQALGSVDVQTYEAVTTYIYGDTAQAIFTATAALARIETISSVLRRVVGQDLTCFEKFPEVGSTDPITYTCKFIVQQGGKVVRPAL